MGEGLGYEAEPAVWSVKLQAPDSMAVFKKYSPLEGVKVAIDVIRVVKRYRVFNLPLLVNCEFEIEEEGARTSEVGTKKGDGVIRG